MFAPLINFLGNPHRVGVTTPSSPSVALVRRESRTPSTMKRFIVLAFAGLCPAIGAKAGEVGQVRDRISHEQFSQRLEAKPSENPISKLAQKSRGDRPKIGERKVQEAKSLLSRSEIIAYRGHWTFVPKGAILHVPTRLAARVGDRPVGRLLPWKDFLARNRGWIFAQPVLMEQARGESALSEAVLENHEKLGRVVVAVLHGGPISVKATPSDNDLTVPPKQ